MRIHLITTGGTMEKVYSEQSGSVENLTPASYTHHEPVGTYASKVNRYLTQLRLPDAEIDITPLMNKDSLDMTDADREMVLSAVKAKIADAPVVITHGTDTMVKTGRLLKQRVGTIRYPVVLTGAMTPLGFERSDGLQNLAESLFAARVLPAGVWIVIHGQSFDVDHARKDRALGRFVAD